MKKRLILCFGLVIAVLLLFCTSASAQTEEPQPSKSAAQWKSENYIVLSDREHPENFLVLSKDLCYLKEKTSSGIAVNGNQFTLSNYDVVQQGNSTDGQQGYCIEAGGKYYFGMEDSAVSNANTLSLKQDTMAILDDITPPAAIAVAAYTVGAWIDWKFDVLIDNFDVEGIPFYFHGNGEVFLDHTSDTTENTTHHTIQYYVQPHADDMGFQTETETTTDDVHVCIFSYRGVDILWLDLKLEDFLGKFGVSFTFHDGLILHFDTWGPVPVSGISVEEDGPYIDTGISNVECTGNADVGFQVGVGDSIKPLIEEESITVFYGVTIEGTENDTRFVPEDTKMKWHSCDECVSEDIRTRDGPLTAMMDIIGFDPWSWSTPSKIGPVLKTWHYSKTWNEWGDGDCNRYSYRLSARVLNQNGVPIPNVSVTWPVDSDNPYFPQSQGTTNSFGTAVIYVESGNGRDIIAEATSPVDPSQKISQTQTIHKMEHFDDLTFTLDIPEKYVYFKNSETGEAASWPEDIIFMPFFSENVTLPDTIPTLSGRVFNGWNTKEDGSGTFYAPGTKLTLKDDLTLWAQWQMAGDDWYVIYNANGGTKAPGPQIVRKGQDAVLTTELPENGTLVFKGWAPDPRHPELVYQPGSVLPYDSTKSVMVLYALWDLSPVQRPIHISFDCNGVEDAYIPHDIWMTKDSWVTIEPAIPPLGSSYVFKGWSEDPQATEPEFIPGRACYFDRDTVLYARWSITPIQRPVIISFNANGGIPESVPANCSAEKSAKYRLPVKEPVWDDQHLFLGWSDNPDAAEAKWKAGDVAAFDQDTTLYAVWKAQYKVIEGAGSVWTKGSGKTQRFIADGNITYFTELRIDGKRFADGVRITSGSTVADIEARAMEKLSVGTHSVTFAYEDGEASATFTVSKKYPPTGDTNHPALWLLLILLGTTGITLAGVRAHKEKKR